MIALLDMELELLEPLIATGNVGSPARFTAQGPPARNLRGMATPGRNRSDGKMEQELNDRDNQFLMQEQLARDLEASVLNTDLGRLVLPVWYADEAQFVPGRMVANNVKIIAEGVGESARTWAITTTDVHELAAERVTGGKQI